MRTCSMDAHEIQKRARVFTMGAAKLSSRNTRRASSVSPANCYGNDTRVPMGAVSGKTGVFSYPRRDSFVPASRY
jgi:hypothetical protein